jgi:integrase
MAPGDHGQPWTRLLPDGRHLGAVYARGPGGRRVRVTRVRATARLARAAVVEAAADLTPDGDGLLSPRTTYRDAVAVWLEHKATSGVGATTLDTYRKWATVTVDAMGDLRLIEISRGRLRAVFDGLAPRYTVASLRHLLIPVSGTLRLAAAFDAIPDPTVARGVIERRAPRKSPTALDAAEAFALIATLRADPLAPTYVADIALVQVGTGLRIGEALALRWRDVDLEHRRLTVSGNLVVVTGVGVVRNGGKTAASLRTLALPHFVAVRLRELRQRQPDRPVFANDDGEWLYPIRVFEALRAALDRAGRPDVTSHIWRRTAASILDAAGLPLSKIADALGHSSTRTTQDSYLVRGRDPGAAAEALDRAWGQPNGESR